MGVNFSKQREIIRKVIKESPIHPTADMVYSIVNKTFPSISLATIYRNLNVLVEMNEVQKIPVINGKDRFDANISKHYHMVCNKCNQVFDAPSLPLNDIQHFYDDKTSFEIYSHHLIFYGVCRECQQKFEHTSQKRSQ